MDARKYTVICVLRGEHVSCRVEEDVSKETYFVNSPFRRLWEGVGIRRHNRNSTIGTKENFNPLLSKHRLIQLPFDTRTWTIGQPILRCWN